MEDTDRTDGVRGGCANELSWRMASATLSRATSPKGAGDTWPTSSPRWYVTRLLPYNVSFQLNDWIVSMNVDRWTFSGGGQCWFSQPVSSSVGWPLPSFGGSSPLLTETWNLSISQVIWTFCLPGYRYLRHAPLLNTETGYFFCEIF